MYGESKGTSTQTFVTLPGGIEQDPRTAVTRIPAELVCPATAQSLRHIMPFSVVDRPDGATAADLAVYSRCEEIGGHVYVNAHVVKRAPGECPTKPLAFDTAAECESEAAAAQQLLRRGL